MTGRTGRICRTGRTGRTGRMLDRVALGAQSCHLGGLEGPFWHPGVPFGRSRGTRGYPTGHLGVQIWIFIDFGWILGPSWDPLWGHLGDFFILWGSKVAVWVPEWVFQ